MYLAITNDISVKVETFYQQKVSQPEFNNFVFAYRVTIDNHSQFSVKLLRRHWFIVDSNGVKKEVEGEGVIGLQPIIEPNLNHSYISGCNLGTDMGKMYGTYTMERVMDGIEFDIEIPEFYLIAPVRMN